MKKQEAIFRLPKMKRRKVWIGYYFNHYNAIVIYHTKPTLSKEENRHIAAPYYDTFENQKNIAGCISLQEFKDWFPGLDISEIIDKETGYVKGLESINLMEIYLTAVWDGNRLENYDFHMDGY